MGSVLRSALIDALPTNLPESTEQLLRELLTANANRRVAIDQYGLVSPQTNAADKLLNSLRINLAARIEIALLNERNDY